MIIQAQIKKGSSGAILELLTNEFTADLHFYKSFWIEPAVSMEGDGYKLQVSVPDRRETLAVIDPLPEDMVEYLKEILPKSDYQLKIMFKEFEGEEREAVLERPGNIPVSFDFSGRINEYMEKFRGGDFDGAINVLTTLEMENDRFPFIDLYKAELHIRLNELNKAEIHLQKELKRRPNNFIAHCSMGYLYRIVGKDATAKESYLKSLEIYPNYMNAILSITYLLSEPEQLELTFARAYRINPSHPAIKQIIGEREAELGELEQFMEKVDKKSVKINLFRPIYIPGITKKVGPDIDPDAGDLTKEDVFKFCLEEIISDGKLNEREKRILTEIKNALMISNEEHMRIFKEVELNFRKKKLQRDSELKEENLYRRIIERVLADGKVSESEKDILKKVSNVLLIDKGTHQRVLKEVMVEKGFSS